MTIVVVILTETRTGTVGTGTPIAGMIGTVIPTVVTAGIGGIVAARLRVAGTRQTIVGVGATPGVRLVAVARLVDVTTKFLPPALCHRPMASLVGKRLPDGCSSISWNKRWGTRVSVGNAKC